MENIDGLNCFVSINTPGEPPKDNSGGIDDGSGKNSTVIEDPEIKRAYALISQNCSVIDEFNIDEESNYMYLNFYSHDEVSDTNIYYGTFTVTQDGKFIAHDTSSDIKYYYQGEENLYTDIIAVIASCRC